jgi:hypothetical protein
VIVDEIIARINGLALFRIVDGAAALSLIKDQPTAMPAAYVFVSEEASAPNTRIGAVLQRTEIDVAVVLFAQSVADPRGAAASASIDTLKAAVRSSLCAYQPPSAEDVVTHIGGKLIKARDGIVCFEDTFGTAVYTGGD